MDELIQLALRNWNFSGDPKFAVEFINLFKRSGLETPKTQKGNKIWVVLFNHGHGRDVSVYSSEEEADAASANLVLELLDDDDFDNESLEQEIRNAPSIGRSVSMRDNADFTSMSASGCVSFNRVGYRMRLPSRLAASLPKASDSICRIRSRVRPSSSPISLSVHGS